MLTTPNLTGDTAIHIRRHLLVQPGAVIVPANKFTGLIYLYMTNCLVARFKYFIP